MYHITEVVSSMSPPSPVHTVRSYSFSSIPACQFSRGWPLMWRVTPTAAHMSLIMSMPSIQVVPSRESSAIETVNSRRVPSAAARTPSAPSA